MPEAEPKAEKKGSVRTLATDRPRGSAARLESESELDGQWASGRTPRHTY